MDEQQLKNEITTVDDRVNSIVVNDPDTFQKAGSVVIDLDGLIKKINTYWEDPIKKAHEAHKSLTAKRAEMLKPVEDRKKLLRGKISAYLTEQDRIKREEQRKLDDERRKKEQAEREKLERAAIKAEEKGKIERAEDLRTQAADVYVQPAIVESQIEKTTRMETGTVSQKRDIRVAVSDPMAVLHAIIGGRLPIGIVNINETKLKQAIKLAGITQLDGCIIEQVINAQIRAS